MKRIFTFFDQYATGRNVLIFLLLQIVFNVAIFPSFAAVSPTGQALPILDLMFGFTPDKAYQILAAYGEEGRASSKFIGTIIDTIYPVVYTILNILAITFLYKKFLPEGSLWKQLSLFPILVMIFDFIENYGIVAMINSFPQPNNAAAHLASTAGMIKWTLVAITIFFILFGLIMWFVKSRQKQHQK